MNWCQLENTHSSTCVCDQKKSSLLAAVYLAHYIHVYLSAHIYARLYVAAIKFCSQLLLYGANNSHWLHPWGRAEFAVCCGVGQKSRSVAKIITDNKKKTTTRTWNNHNWNSTEYIYVQQLLTMPFALLCLIPARFFLRVLAYIFFLCAYPVEHVEKAGKRLWSCLVYYAVEGRNKNLTAIIRGNHKII